VRGNLNKTGGLTIAKQFAAVGVYLEEADDDRFTGLPVARLGDSHILQPGASRMPARPELQGLIRPEPPKKLLRTPLSGLKFSLKPKNRPKRHLSLFDALPGIPLPS